MNIEIIKDNKKIKLSKKPKRIEEFNMMQIDFNSINGLKNNKHIVNFLFKGLKIELLQNG
jgi:hypothetical protein